MSRDVYLVQSADWQAVYVDGEIVDQGHNIDWMFVIAELGCNTYIDTVDQQWAEDQGYFPDNLNDVCLSENYK